MKHRDYDVLNKGAKILAGHLREVLEKRILGPEYPLVSRIKNRYIKNILIKIEREAPLSQIKQSISDQINLFRKEHKYKAIQVQVDVDPQ